MTSETAGQLDGAQLAILHNRFEGICRKMGNTLLRTGRSGVLNRAKDFSCCIVTGDCALLAAAESLPIHVLSGPDLMLVRPRTISFAALAGGAKNISAATAASALGILRTLMV